MENGKMTKRERKQLKKQQKLMNKEAETQKALRIKLLTYVVIGLVIFLAGYMFYNQIVPVPDGEEIKSVDQVMTMDWVKGNAEAAIVLIEYSDFQCPACASYVDMIDDLVGKYGDDLAVVYRHFPLKQIHLQAELAAQAAEAAGKQGKFWEMHDILFRNQSNWAESAKAKSQFIDYAEEIGLDISKFKSDLGSKEVRGYVKADFLSGLSLRLNSTPSFYINGERISNPTSPQAFEELINSQLPSTASAEIE